MDERTDEQLVSQFYSGQQEAFNELFARYKGPIFNFCFRILGVRADAEDVTSEVFMALAQRRYILRAEARCKTWIYTVARNTCLSCIRKRKYQISLWFSRPGEEQETQRELADNGQMPPDEIIRKEQVTVLKNGLQSLTIREREALILREYQKLTYQEIAVVMDCSLENVKIHIFRARQHLRALLLKEHPELFGRGVDS